MDHIFTIKRILSGQMFGGIYSQLPKITSCEGAKRRDKPK
uniref:Uncharacterized protein n=1 Tax=Rhizophora mucronata TaxID=61149 RepID=A0A2P2QE65_RHIMU